MRLQYFSDVKDGKLQKNVSMMIAEEIKHFEGKRIQITIQRHSSKRSLAQNNLFHLYIGIMAKELGYELEDMKEIIKFKFLLAEKASERTGEIMQYIRQTRGLTKLEFIDLIDGLIRFASTLQIVLPDPQGHYDEIYGKSE